MSVLNIGHNVFTRDYVSQLINNERNIVLYAVDGLAVVGAIVLMPRQTSLEIYAMGVLGTANKAEYQKALVTEAVRRARQLGLSEVKALSLSVYSDLLALYPSLGFSNKGFAGCADFRLTVANSTLGLDNSPNVGRIDTMNNNKLHREVGLQSSLKMVISLISGLFTSKSDIDRAIRVINTVAGNDPNVGFLNRLSGTGTILGNVMIIDLNVPLMYGYPKNKRDEAAFNKAVAKALIAEFGRLNVGYVTPEPVKAQTVTVRVETDLTTQDILNALSGVTVKAEVV